MKGIVSYGYRNKPLVTKDHSITFMQKNVPLQETYKLHYKCMLQAKKDSTMESQSGK